MQKHLPKHLSKKSIASQSLLVKKRKNDWKNKPASWPDIRKNAQEGHIYLLVDTRYPIGFIATATDGYSVKIDGIDYDDYTSNEQFSMANWADYSDTPGYDITEPTGATKAHIIDISPQTESENITKFIFARVSGNTQQEQGCLWCHFNISNSINLERFSANTNIVWQKLCEAITAKNNVIKFTSLGWLLRGMPNISYLPVFDGNNNSLGLNYFASDQTKLKAITLKNSIVTDADSAFVGSSVLETIKTINCTTNYSANTSLNTMFGNVRKLKKLPDIFKKLTANVTSARAYLTNATSLEEDVIIDATEATNITRLECYGTSTYFMPRFKGLRVSNEAPLNNATSPQINVSYTGMDRAALVQLFNDLPTVSGGQIINIVGCTGTANLTAEDELIATAKGWTITK